YEPRWANIADANTRHARAQGATGHGMIARGDSVDLPAILPAAVHGRISLVITSPPYGPTVHGHVRPTGGGIVKHADTYGDPDSERGNLAHHNHDGLIDGFTQILSGCRHVLAPGGVVVVTARPYRRRGELIDLPSAVIAAGEKAGLTPIERCYALLAGVRDGHLAPRPSFFQLHAVRKARRAGTPMHLIVHEDVLVLAKQRKSGGSGELRGCDPGSAAA
ncbi:MAG: site-specific DNA-methyltransferase, partial [Micromonosporaceae bacterium]